MALCDYILCCGCKCKLIYDGYGSQREWWHDRWGKEPQIKCPDCETQPRKPLTEREIEEAITDEYGGVLTESMDIARAIEQAHGIKE